MFKMVVLSNIGDKISDIVRQGLEILFDTDNAITSIIIQLVATLILFLCVKFLFWDKITKMLEDKEQEEKKAYEDLANAKKEKEEIQNQIAIDTEKAKQEGYKIIEKAKQKSYLEAEAIIKKAQIDANMKLEDAKEQIEKEVAKANGDIKKEIVETAYLLASEIINKEIKEEKYKDLVDDFLNKEVK